MSETVGTENEVFGAINAVLRKSEDSFFLKEEVRGYDWNKGINYRHLLETYENMGFQATNFGLAIKEINKMIECREQPQPSVSSVNDKDPLTPKNNCTIFMGYTSNIVSSGLRETIKFLVQHKLIDCVVTTAGGIEEDLIKCLAPTYLGDFHLDGNVLRDKAINRIGNLLAPNDNYRKFQDWIMPLLDELLREQNENGTIWSPSKVIKRMGDKINNEESIYYWAARNDIPVFCPAITDGSIGDMIFFHSFKHPGLIIDIVSDIRRLDLMAIKAFNSGMIIVGGGLIKHHICNANSMRNGAEYAVYLNTASEYDGSDAGARPDEAKSWGKIKKTATPIKIFAEATLVFPLLVGETFAKHYFANSARNES
ncbi:hypothetical protein RI129_008639 [Pyrocoelia pectoralis]|uniref:deoxyhypusine synthase n=1 Tax=Pyrocoelia pectoralis TaxID=417401 RepID=A0AAN7ZHK1_9COLE